MTSQIQLSDGSQSMVGSQGSPVAACDAHTPTSVLHAVPDTHGCPCAQDSPHLLRGTHAPPEQYVLASQSVSVVHVHGWHVGGGAKHCAPAEQSAVVWHGLPPEQQSCEKPFC